MASSQSFSMIQRRMLDGPEPASPEKSGRRWRSSNRAGPRPSPHRDAATQRILFGAATAPLTGIGLFLGKDGADYEFRAGNPAGDFMHWDGTNLSITGTLTAASGTIGGWTLSANDLSSGSVKINSTNEQLLFGSATAPLTGTGIFLGKDGTDYEFRAGNPAGDFMHWDGTNLKVTGAIITAPGNGSALTLLGWTHNLLFSATDNDTVAWSAGTITLGDGQSFSIAGGNTGNITVPTYIYLDKGVSLTSLQTTGTASTAVGANRLLVAVAENVADTDKDAEFVVYGGSGGVGVSKTVLAGVVAANVITANEIAANTITGAQIASLNIATKTITAAAGTIGGWTLSGSDLTSGSVKIQSSAERILMGSATAPLTGTGIFLGKDGTDYEFRAGNPAGDHLHWDGSTLSITGTLDAPKVTGDIVNTVTSSSTRISGGTGFTAGANIILRGSTATNANDMILGVGSSSKLQWDNSAAIWLVTNDLLLNNGRAYRMEDSAGTSVSLLGLSSGNTVNVGAVDATAGAGNISFHVDGVADKMLLVSDALLIGTTTSRGSRVLIESNTSANHEDAQLSLIDSSAIAATSGGFLNFGGIYSGSSRTEWAAIGGVKATASTGQDGGDLVFETRSNGGSLTERMRIDADGNVGINQAPVLHQLAITRTAGDEVLLLTHNHTSAPRGLLIKYGSGQDGTGDHAITFRDGSTKRMEVRSDGDVWTVDSGILTSDATMKENVVDTTSKLDDVLALRVVNFNWAPELFPVPKNQLKKRIGFIAQEVELIFPALVGESEMVEELRDGEGNTTRQAIYKKDLKASAIGAPILVKAFQESVAEYRSEITLLKARIATLEQAA